MLHFRNLGLVFFATILILALTPTTGRAQNVYGTIAGTVTDATGAAISEAAVTLTNLGTAETHKTTTDSSGNYTFVNLVPGRYRVEAVKTGFKNFARERISWGFESGLRSDIAF